MGSSRQVSCFFTGCLILMLMGGISFAKGNQPPQEGRGGGDSQSMEQGDRQKPPPPPTAEMILKKMKEELNLTDKQVKQITPIIENEIKQMNELMKKSGGIGKSQRKNHSGKSSKKSDNTSNENKEMDPNHEKMDAIHKETESKLSQYLSAEQMEKWREMHKPPQRPEGGDSMMGRSGEEKEGERPPLPPEN